MHASANYNDNQLAKDAYITTAMFIAKHGVYNTYGTNISGDKRTVVIFDDQPDLLDLVHNNQGSLLTLQFLIPSNNKYKYLIDTRGMLIEAVTVAKATLVIDKYDMPSNFSVKGHIKLLNIT